MKNMKLEISKLMDRYTDTEFAPREGNYVDTDNIRDRVMAQIPAKKKHPLKFKLAVVAAAMAACVGLTAAGLPNQVYHLISGGSAIIGGNQASITLPGEGEGTSPIMEDGGRLWFVADGQKTDITGQVSEDTPYLYTTEEEDGTRHYFAVGGTQGNYGWAEWLVTQDGEELGSAYNIEAEQYVELDGKTYAYGDLTQEQLERVEKEFIGITAELRPWYTSARAQFGLSD